MHQPRITNSRSLSVIDRNTEVPRFSKQIASWGCEDVEKSVLGFFLSGADAIEQLAGDIDESFFFDPINQVIFHTILALHNEHLPVELLSLTDRLRRQNNLEKVGGPAAVTELGDKYSCPGIASARYYVELLRDRAARRRLAILSREILQLCEQENIDVFEVLSHGEEKLGELRSAFGTPRKPLIEFMSPREIQAYVPPKDLVLVGDCHVTRGQVFLIAGPPGVGKSRATVALAQAGATGESWFALPVRHRFKTMIVQNENGSFRLRQEFANLEGTQLDDWIRVSRPPRSGLCFDRVEFRTALARSIAKFQPGLVILDPWNAVARDEKARDYLETFEAIREVIPTGDQSPALGIVAHTRKPKTDERPSGRALLHEIAGSHVIGSLPRCAFVMQSASDDSAESRVVWSNCKNNDGSLAPRSA